MPIKFQRIRFLLITICLLAAILGVAINVLAGLSQTAEAQEPQDQTVSIKASRAERLAALEMWTREARAAAQPLPFPVGSVDELMQDSAEELSGEPGSAEGGLPHPKADRRARRQYPEEWEVLLNELDVEDSLDTVEALGTAGKYTSYLGNRYKQMYQQFPFRGVGKLYITSGGYCSASVISPNNIIVTAAHCVYDTDTNTWLSGWTFVPADRKGVAPYGTFPWVSARVLTAWINAGSSTAGRRYDVALIRLGNNSAGNPVTFYTGWLGRSWDYGYTQHLHAIGYPGNLKSGKFTYICAAESFKQATDILGMGCNMMHGSSGGPWERVFQPYASGANNYVNSVVSGGLSGPTWGNTFYGARFSSKNIVKLCDAEGC